MGTDFDYKAYFKAKDGFYSGGCSCNGRLKEEYAFKGKLITIYPKSKTFKLPRSSEQSILEMEQTLNSL